MLFSNMSTLAWKYSNLYVHKLGYHETQTESLQKYKVLAKESIQTI